MSTQVIPEQGAQEVRQQYRGLSPAPAPPPPRGDNVQGGLKGWIGLARCRKTGRALWTEGQPEWSSMGVRGMFRAQVHLEAAGETDGLGLRTASSPRRISQGIRGEGHD